MAELYAIMKCLGTCQFLRGLWMDMTGMALAIHLRTDANNLVSTASTTHLPEQKETVHMITNLRREACSGAIEDFSSRFFLFLCFYILDHILEVSLDHILEVVAPANRCSSHAPTSSVSYPQGPCFP